MLQLVGSKSKFCDGISRRSFLNVGSLALGGLSLPQLLKADELSGNKTRHKSVIMIFLPGGPSHLDIWDLKPDAPIEIRGEFQPIQSSIPGFPICEHLPKFAQNLDRFTIIRSLVGAKNEHASELCLSGFGYQDSKIRNQPSLGSAISYLQGPVDRGMPPFVSMVYHTNNLWRDPGRAGFVGSAHKPFQPNDEGKADMVLQMSRNRLNDRRQLLQSVDRLKRAVEVSDVMQSVDSYTSQALHMLTSNRLLEALDISKESPETLARYGQGNRDAVDDGSPMNNEDFLIARRLVEAGARCVSVSFGRWDTHSCRKAGDLAYKNNFAQLKEYLPRLEQCLLALTQDLQERGLEDDVAVVVWGEMGRTPRINANGGRDHWPQVSGCILAGGGFNHGQVLGSTTRLAEEAKDRPIHYQNVFASLYQHLGIDVAKVKIPDFNGRPQYLLQHREGIPELG
ncbi:MAG TPA: DUF1501 domain-containing protein [Planctomycetaceae bacterium]|nr:DUF1501 domain-containing protein [Planctomycetaceae bacterium]|tara:strand:+ start:6912 stop:8270 length:1359 start_codon:yes stop_codon:yes gene_type:complete